MAEVLHTTLAKRLTRTEGAVLIFGVVASALSLVWRSFVGPDLWHDEPYQLTTTLRFMMGDRPLVDSWDTNFSSAVAAMPFAYVYLFLNGSTDGILLAYRGVFLLLSVATSLTAWFALRSLLGMRLAIAISILLLLYLPWLSPLVGYGADWLWHMLAAFTAVRLFAHPPQRMISHAVPGLLCGLAIIGNPPTLSVVPFFAAALLIAHRPSGPGTAWRIMGCYLLGGLLVGAVFMVALRAMAGPDMFSWLHHVLAPDDHDFGVSAYGERLWHGRWLLALPAGIGLLAAVLVRALRNRLDEIGVSTALVLGLSLGLAAVATQRIPVMWAPQSLVFIGAASLLVAEAFSGNWSWSPERSLLVLPVTGAGLGWFLGSNGGIASAVVTAPLLLVAAVLPWRTPEAPWMESGTGRALRIANWLLLGLLIVTVGTIGMRHTPGGSTASMTSRLDDGPHEGIYSTPQQAQEYRQVLQAVRELPPAQGRTVFVERFALGYLIQPALPGTYSTWATSASSARLQKYGDLTGNAPTRIVLTRFEFHSRDGDFPASVNLDGFPENYELIHEDDTVRVFDLHER